MARILLTGARGFIGSHLLERLQDRHEISSPSSLELDLLDARAVRECLERRPFDVVLHAATWNATRTSHRDPAGVLDANLRFHLNFLRERGLFGRWIHFGSGAEFGREHWHAGMKESEFGDHIPLDDYGLSKFMAERTSGGVPGVLNLRLFGVFGPGEDWRLRFISSNACRALFGRALALRQDRRFDYLHVDDVVSAVELFLEEPGLEGTFNLCRGQGRPLSAIARMILETLGIELPLEIQMPGEDLEYSGDNTKLRSVLPHWAPSPLEAGVAKQVLWLREQRHTLDPDLLVN